MQEVGGQRRAESRRPGRPLRRPSLDAEETAHDVLAARHGPGLRDRK
jgi:hypothetical protein